MIAPQAEVDAAFYAAQKAAEADRLKLTKEYLEFMKYQALVRVGFFLMATVQRCCTFACGRACGRIPARRPACRFLKRADEWQGA